MLQGLPWQVTLRFMQSCDSASRKVAKRTWIEGLNVCRKFWTVDVHVYMLQQLHSDVCFLYVYTCICIYIVRYRNNNVCIHSCTYIYMYFHIRIVVDNCAYMYVYIIGKYLCVCVPSCLYLRIFIRVHAHFMFVSAFFLFQIQQLCVSSCPYLNGYLHLYWHFYMYIHTQTYKRTYIHTYIPTCMHACMHACIHTYIHTYIRT